MVVSVFSGALLISPWSQADLPPPPGRRQQAVVLRPGELPALLPEHPPLDFQEFYPALIPAQEPEQAVQGGQGGVHRHRGVPLGGQVLPPGGGVYNAGTFEMQDGAMIHGNGAKNAAADFYNEAGGTFTLVEAEGYTWYQDGPNQEQRYPKETKVYPIPEPGSEATKAATYLAAEVPLEREDNSDEESPYLIDDAVELAAFRDIVNGSNGGADYLYACSKLTDNIDLSTVCGTEIGSWTPIGLGQAKAYTGTFDGNGKTISGLYCDIFSDDEGGSTLYVGLFGAIGDGNSGEVRNLNVAGDLSASSTKVSVYAGGICGYNLGTITGCTFRGTVNDSVSGSSGSGSAGESRSSVTVGGVCGINNGTIENCWNDGDVDAKNGTSLRAGGVCGQNTGKVTNCLNTGAVTATGTSGDIGGVCGDNSSGLADTGTVTNCYWLNTSCKDGIGSSDQTGATSTTRTELESGEVAYRLNNSTSGGNP